MSNSFYNKITPQEYERQHEKRINHLIVDMGLDQLRNQTIIDVGGGTGFLIKRLDQSNTRFVIDGTDQVPLFDTNNPVFFTRRDLNVRFAEEFNLMRGPYTPFAEDFDYAICAETLEHLENPYNCLLEIKKLLKIDGLLLITIPEYTESGQGHPYIYPCLIKPEGFKQFLGQLAFEIIDERRHDVCHVQQVFLCKNRPLDEAQLVNYKREYVGLAPHELVNV